MIHDFKIQITTVFTKYKPDDYKTCHRQQQTQDEKLEEATHV